jgi:hypothetical protein
LKNTTRILMWGTTSHYRYQAEITLRKTIHQPLYGSVLTVWTCVPRISTATSCLAPGDPFSAESRVFSVRLVIPLLR